MFYEFSNLSKKAFSENLASHHPKKIRTFPQTKMETYKCYKLYIKVSAFKQKKEYADWCRID